jgi:hypothetical protein
MVTADRGISCLRLAFPLKPPPIVVVVRNALLRCTMPVTLKMNLHSHNKLRQNFFDIIFMAVKKSNHIVALLLAWWLQERMP